MVDTVVETTIVTTTVLAYRTTKPEVSPCSYGKHTSRKSSVPAVMNSMSSSVGSSGYRNGTWPIPLLVTSSSALGPTFSSSPLVSYLYSQYVNSVGRIKAEEVGNLVTVRLLCAVAHI